MTIALYVQAGQCLLLAKTAYFGEKSIKSTCRQRGYKESYKVRTKDFQEEISEKYKERNDD